MSKKLTTLKHAGKCLTAVALLATSTVHAELEEIVVTATKRAEGLQDVPVSVSAMSSEMMAAAGITDMAEVSAYIPNFEVSDASILPNLYVRGIGSGTTHSIEQSVGRFIDEIYIGRAAINLHGFMDVASVEVLRGPQGTLFGKNTLGGAMIIHTADPTEEFAAGFNASASDYSTVGGQYTFEGYVSGPLADNLRGRLVAQYKDKDGYIDNLAPGPDGGTREDYGVRAKLAWDITASTTALLKVEHMEYDEAGQTPSELRHAVFPGGPVAGQPVPEGFWQGRQGPDAEPFRYGRRWKSYYDCDAELGPNATTHCPERDQDSQNVTLKVDTEFSAGTATLVVGYQQYEYDHHFVALDMGMYGGGLRATRTEEYDGYSVEARFTSDEYEKYDFIAGAYYEDSNLERRQPSDFDVFSFFGFPYPSPAFNAGPPLRTEIEDWMQDTETVAVFGQYRYHFTDSLSLVLGGRVSYETKDFDLVFNEGPYQGNPYDFIPGAPESAGGPAYATEESRSETEFSPSATVRWEVTAEAMVYLSYARGHKTGGFSDRTAQLFDDAGDEIEGATLAFDPEFNTTWELGMKGVWLDGALETNVAIFTMDITDLQVARAIPGQATSFEVKNAAEATSEGVEFDFRWLLSDAVTLGGNFAYTNAEYDDFPAANPSCPDIGGTQEGAFCNYGGIPLIYAPEYKGAVYLQYSANDVVAGWGVNARIGANYSDEYYTEIGYVERLKQDSFATFDASIRFSSPDKRHSIALTGRNLSEEHVIDWGLQAGFSEFTAPNAPREIAVKYSFKL